MDINTFEVGWVCAISTELVAACELLDEEYEESGISNIDSKNDANSYKFGRMGRHKIILSCLPKGVYGTTSAASVARDMMRSFPSIRFGLMVGVGGGAPSKKHDIRLGDIVVGCPSASNGGVINIQYGKNIQGNDFLYTGTLSPPPRVLLSALNLLSAQHESKGHNIQNTVLRVLENPRLRSKYSNPGQEHDHLFESSFLHPEAEMDCDLCCLKETNALKTRPPRAPGCNDPAIHYGVIASSDNLMKNAEERDALIEKYDVLCFEMEAAGLMDHFPCLVIRGICDYSDTHKNKKWQGYAAAVAAAYAKELLNIVPSKERLHRPTPASRRYRGLFTVHSPQNSCDVDVVAVHGLGGDATSTWTAPTGFRWLHDWLPAIADASVLTYDYDSATTWDGRDISIHRTATELLEILHAERPERRFVFLCHGLGGVIVKTALALISLTPKFSQFHQNIVGLIFLGTPQTSHVHELWQIIYRMSNALLSGKTYRVAVMEKVEQISGAICAMSRDRLFDFTHLPILSFYETMPIVDLGSVIVEPEVVIIASAREEVLSASGNHITMAAPDRATLEHTNSPYASIANLLAHTITKHASSSMSTSTGLLDKLYSVDYELYTVGVPDASPRTGLWLWDLDLFRSWASSSESGMFWVRAPPGYGKTVMTKGLARDLKFQDTVRKGLQPFRGFTRVVYFFREETAASTSMVSLLRSLLHQLLLQYPKLEAQILQAFDDSSYKGRGNVRSDPCLSPKDLLGALQSVLHNNLLQKVILLIDGLDEASPIDMQNVCSGLTEILSMDRNSNILKIFVTSRDNRLISNNFSSSKMIKRFDVTPEHTSRDIETFLDTSIAIFAEEQNVPDDIKNNIKTAILSKAEGMFLWTTLAWEHFRNGVAIWTQSLVRARIKALEGLPPGLPQLYNSLLKKIDEKVLEGLHAVFLIIIAAARPITCEEIEQMLGIRGWELRTSDLDIPFSIRATIAIYCANLLKIDSAGYVKVVHLSLKEFLRASVLKKEMDVLHRKIASDCIFYLTLLDVREEAQRDITRSRNDSCLMKRFPFYNYAATYLVTHMKHVSIDDHLWQQYAAMTRDYAAFHVGASSLHHAHVNKLQVKAPVYYRLTPLVHALRLHGISLIQSFARQGYNLDEMVYGFRPSGFEAETAMHVYTEKPAFIAELLKCGASPNIANYCGRTPLHEAVLRGHHETTKTLLSHSDVDLNAQDVEGRTPLHYEASSGRFSLLLHDPRVDTTVRDHNGRTAVTTAAFWGDHETTLTFLRSARNALAQHEGELSILIAVAQQGWHDIALNIVNQLTDISDHRGYDGKNILHWAAINNWEDALLRASAKARTNMNDTDKRLRTPLHDAAELGHSRLARKLVSLGASAKMRDRQGRTALQLATIQGFSDTVLALMDSNFDVNSADNQNRTLLHWAASWNLPSIMRRVLEQPEVNYLKRDHMGRTALHVAALCGCSDVLKLLRDQGAFNVNDKDAVGNTILHLAARSQTLSTVKVILSFSNFTKRRSRNNYGQTALDTALIYYTPLTPMINGVPEIAEFLWSSVPRRASKIGNQNLSVYNSMKQEPVYHTDWIIVHKTSEKRNRNTAVRSVNVNARTIKTRTQVKLDKRAKVELSDGRLVSLAGGASIILNGGRILTNGEGSRLARHFGATVVFADGRTVKLKDGNFLTGDDETDGLKIWFADGRATSITDGTVVHLNVKESIVMERDKLILYDSASLVRLIQGTPVTSDEGRQFVVEAGSVGTPEYGTNGLLYDENERLFENGPTWIF